MLKKMQTVGVLLLSLAFSYGGQLHAMEVRQQQLLLNKQTNLQGLLKMSLGL